MAKIKVDIRSIKWSNLDPVEGVFRDDDYIEKQDFPTDYIGVALRVKNTDYFTIEDAIHNFLVDDTTWPAEYFTFSVTYKN